LESIRFLKVMDNRKGEVPVEIDKRLGSDAAMMSHCSPNALHIRVLDHVNGLEYDSFKTALPLWSKQMCPFAIALCDFKNDGAMTEISLRDKITGEYEMTIKMFLPLYNPICIGEEAVGMTVITVWKDVAKYFMSELKSDFENRKDPTHIVQTFLYTKGGSIMGNTFNCAPKNSSWVMWTIKDYDDNSNETKNVTNTLRKILGRTFANETELPIVLNYNLWSHDSCPFAIHLSDFKNDGAMTELSIRDKITGEFERTIKLFLPLGVYSADCIGEAAEGMTVLTLWKDAVTSFMYQLKSEFKNRNDTAYIVSTLVYQSIFAENGGSAGTMYEFESENPSWVMWSISDYDDSNTETQNVMMIFSKTLDRTISNETNLPIILC
jgi:hypothetical protein